MVADVPTLKEGNFHTQIICLKEGPVRTGDSDLTEEKNVMLIEKAQREDLFFNWFTLVCNGNQRPLQNAPFCPISALDSNFKPRNTQCIPTFKIFAFLELEQN